MSQKGKKSIAAASLILFNILDTFFTLKYIKYGPLEEANPLLSSLVEQQPCLFAFLKIFFVTLFSIFLWCNSRKVSYGCLAILSLSYTLLMIFWTFVVLHI
jgi:hypothetical protein